MLEKPLESRVARSSSLTFSERVAFLFERRCFAPALDLFQPESGERVLDVGFGAGQAILALAQRCGPGGKVYGIDPSRAMYETTAQRVREAGFQERVALHCAKSLPLPYMSEFFDGVFFGFSLGSFPDEVVAGLLAECRRTLRPQGRICVAGISGVGKPTLMRRLYQGLNGTFPRMLNLRPLMVGRSLQDAGFRVVRTQNHSIVGLKVEIALARNAPLT